MKLRTLAMSTLAALAGSALAAGTAGAATVAAWDFSQYQGSGFLTTDGTTFALSDTLDANYSDLDPNSIGSESAQFGTLYLDGSNGSSAASLTSPFTPNSLDLTVNNDVLEDDTVTLGSTGSLNVLGFEGQANTNLLSLGSSGDVGSVVFGADLSSIPEFGDGFTVSFGAVNQNGGDSSIGVEFSPDGSSYASIGTANVTGSAGVFSFDATASGDQAFFRLNFGDPANIPVVDNVGINTALVPEPGTALLLGGGLAGLAAFGRRRRG